MPISLVQQSINSAGEDLIFLFVTWRHVAADNERKCNTRGRQEPARTEVKHSTTKTKARRHSCLAIPSLCQCICAPANSSSSLLVSNFVTSCRTAGARAIRQRPTSLGLPRVLRVPRQQHRAWAAEAHKPFSLKQQRAEKYLQIVSYCRCTLASRRLTASAAENGKLGGRLTDSLRDKATPSCLILQYQSPLSAISEILFLLFWLKHWHSWQQLKAEPDLRIKGGA